MKEAIIESLGNLFTLFYGRLHIKVSLFCIFILNYLKLVKAGVKFFILEIENKINKIFTNHRAPNSCFSE